MQALILALLLATVSQHGGRLLVHVTPGVEIFVDGVDAGTSTAAEGGKLVSDIVPGPHRVVVRSADGREASFNVVIYQAQTTEANVSPLGFRKLNRPAQDDDSSVLTVTSIPAEAIVEFNGTTRENHDATQLTFENIPPGRYVLTINPSSNPIRGEIEIPKASVMTVDVSGAKVHVTDTKSRPRRMQIAEANDALARLAVPSNWKSSIRSALPNTVSVVDAWSDASSVRVRLKVPSDRMAVALLRSMSSSSAFTRVDYGSSPHREQSGWLVDFVFYFPVR